jgi:hypothetical protein
MYGPTALDTSCLSVFRQTLCDVLFASSSMPSANTEVVTMSCVVCLRCTTSLLTPCFAALLYTHVLYIVCVVHNYAHTVTYLHAALLYFVIHYCSVLFLLLSLPPPLSVTPAWFSCRPCCVSLTPRCSHLPFTLVLLTMMSFGCCVRLGCYAS